MSLGRPMRKRTIGISPNMMKGHLSAMCVVWELLRYSLRRSNFLKDEVPAELGVTPHVSIPHLMLSPVYPYHRAHAPSSTLHSSRSILVLSYSQPGRYTESVGIPF